MRHALRLVVATVFLALLSVAANAAAMKAAPDFTLKSSAGKNVRLGELKGDVVLVNFWATWCGPCRQEMPELEKLYGKYKDLGFTLLGVNVEADDSPVAQYLRDVKVTFPVLYDTENRIAKLYGVDGMPSTVIIDRDGNVRYVHRGYKPGTEAVYADEVKKLVME